MNESQQILSLCIVTGLLVSIAVTLTQILHELRNVSNLNCGHNGRLYEISGNSDS